jgi:excisionase family DNA binding protein
MREGAAMKYATSAEVAAVYRVSEPTVRAWAHAGVIPSIRPNRGPLRFDLAAVEAALKTVVPQAQGARP